MGDSEYSLIQIFKWFVIKEKSIYSEMNKLKNEEKILRGCFWLPKKMMGGLEEKLDEMRSRRNIAGPQIHLVKELPDEELFVRPTHIETNAFTWPF
jgi:hypothetical protein